MAPNRAGDNTDGRAEFSKKAVAINLKTRPWWPRSSAQTAPCVRPSVVHEFPSRRVPRAGRTDYIGSENGGSLRFMKSSAR